MYHWYLVILIQPSLKEIFLFKWKLIGDVVGFFIHPTAGSKQPDTLFICVLELLLKENCFVGHVSLREDNITMLYLISPKEAYEYLFKVF